MKSLFVILVPLTLPQLAAGGAREQIRLRKALAHIDQIRSNQYPLSVTGSAATPLQPVAVPANPGVPLAPGRPLFSIPAMLPCAFAGDGFYQIDPCTPDLAGNSPMRQVSDEQVAAANMQQFMNEIVADEDEKIRASNEDTAKEYKKIEQKQFDAVEELGKTQERSEAAVAKAQEKAKAKLQNATSTMLKNVAVKAELVGEQQQLAKDQELISAFLSKVANSSEDQALLAEVKSVKDSMTADRAESVSKKLKKEAEAEAAKVPIRDQEVNSAIGTAATDRKEAMKKVDAFAQVASDHVLAINEALRSVQNTAGDSLAGTMDSEKQFESVYDAPAAFVKGVSESTIKNIEAPLQIAAAARLP